MTYMCSGIFGIQHPNQAVNLTTTLKYLVFTSKFLSAWLCFALNSRLRLQRISLTQLRQPLHMALCSLQNRILRELRAYCNRITTLLCMIRDEWLRDVEELT
jgi:hypothetical protein